MHACVKLLRSWSCSLHRFVKTKMFQPNTPEEVDAHNLNIQLAKDGMYFDVDSYSDDEFEGEQDDFDFTRYSKRSYFGEGRILTLYLFRVMALIYPKKK